MPVVFQLRTTNLRGSALSNFENRAVALATASVIVSENFTGVKAGVFSKGPSMDPDDVLGWAEWLLVGAHLDAEAEKKDSVLTAAQWDIVRSLVAGEDTTEPEDTEDDGPKSGDVVATIEDVPLGWLARVDLRTGTWGHVLRMDPQDVETLHHVWDINGAIYDEPTSTWTSCSSDAMSGSADYYGGHYVLVEKAEHHDARVESSPSRGDRFDSLGDLPNGWVAKCYTRDDNAAWDEIASLGYGDFRWSGNRADRPVSQWTRVYESDGRVSTDDCYYILDRPLYSETTEENAEKDAPEPKAGDRFESIEEMPYGWVARSFERVGGSPHGHTVRVDGPDDTTHIWTHDQHRAFRTQSWSPFPTGKGITSSDHCYHVLLETVEEYDAKIAD